MRDGCLTHARNIRVGCQMERRSTLTRVGTEPLASGMRGHLRPLDRAPYSGRVLWCLTTD